MEEYRRRLIDNGVVTNSISIATDPNRRAEVSSEIDVLVAREVYGLTKREMLYILDPDNVLGPDCGGEAFKALRNAELREFKEFRTQRLIMEAWDRM